MNLQSNLAHFAFPLLVSRAIQVSAGIPAAKAVVLLIVQTEPRKKSSAFQRRKEMCVCVCAFGWQSEFFELLVLSLGSEPTKNKYTKSLGCQAAFAKLLLGSAGGGGL